MVSSSSSKVVSFALLGGFLGALVMGAVAYMMPIPNTGGAPFFVAAAMLMGLGSSSWVAGWMLHLVTGLVVGAIFGVAVVKVARLGLTTARRGLALGAAAGVAVFVLWFIPMMALLMPALMGMPTMVGGAFVAHAMYGLVLGGVTSIAISKDGSSYKCPTCGATFGTQHELVHHSETHMSSTPRQEFKCPACGATFATQKELMEHNAKAHPM